MRLCNTLSFIILIIAFCNPSKIFGKTDFIIYEALKENIDPEYGVSLIDSMLYKVSDSNLSPEIKKKLIKRKFDLSMSIGDYVEASSALDSLQKYKDSFSLVDWLRIELDMAICGLYSGSYSSAINTAFKVLNEKKSDSLNYLDADAYIVLSNIGNRTGDLERSEEYLFNAYNITKEIKNEQIKKEYEYKILLGFSSLNLLKKDYDLAYEYLKKSDSIKIEGISPFCLENNLAIVYTMEGSPEMAEKYYKEILSSKDIHYNKSVALNNYADFLMTQGRKADALKILDINLSQLKRVNAAHALSIRQLMRFQVLKDLGETQKAIESADSALNMFLGLIDVENQRSHSFLHDSFEVKRKDEELGVANKKNSEYIRWITVLSFSLLVLIILMGLLKIRIKKLKKEVTLWEGRIEEDQKKFEDQIKVTKDDIESKNRELAKLELKNMQMRLKIKSISENTDYLKKNNDEVLNSIRKTLSETSFQKGDWVKFEKYFEEIQPKFYEKLHQINPDLTVGERRMCAFILTGMKTAEIASLCNRSTRTIESMKYRLKKKLNISSTESLDNYLLSLSI